MGESTAGFRPLAAASKQFVRKLLILGENRIELLAVEMREERDRLLRAFLLTISAAAFGLLAGVAFTAAIVFLCLPCSPAIMLLILTVVYGAVGAYFWWRLARLLGDWQTLSASLDQLRKDRLCLEKILA